MHCYCEYRCYWQPSGGLQSSLKCLQQIQTANAARLWVNGSLVVDATCESLT